MIDLLRMLQSVVQDERRSYQLEMVHSDSFSILEFTQVHVSSCACRHHGDILVLEFSVKWKSGDWGCTLEKGARDGAYASAVVGCYCCLVFFLFSCTSISNWLSETAKV